MIEAIAEALTEAADSLDSMETFKDMDSVENTMSETENLDDNGKAYRTDDGGWIPNNTYELDGTEYKTDDYGHIYQHDGEYFPDDFFVKDGQLYTTDENGNLQTETPGNNTESENNDSAIEKNNFERSGFLPGNHGEWSGDAGNSTWHPDPEYTPPEKSRNPEKPYSNPDNLTWEELMDKYGIDGIDFKDGYPVFDEVARGTVEIDDFTDDRDANFTQANEKMAEQRECTPEEVEKWMKDNNYTWHECQDCKTMQKVPNEIHANVPHEGGVSVYKSEHNN